MYKRFYQLVTNPFRLAPEPDFCFSHTGYRCAREYLDFALAEGEGFVLVTGRPGTGKTMLVETFLEDINSDEVIARRIAVSSFGTTDLLHAVAYVFGIDAAGMEEGTIRYRIQQFFVQQEQAGRRVLLIIDEAQTLNHAALEELRILADLQTQSRLMLQLVLVGQESLQELMRTPEMEQFQQRVIANYQLVPLNLKDTRSYIQHRLLCAGWRGDPEFSGAAVLNIYQLSKGVPRHINKICNRLLLLGFGKGNHAFDEQDVLEISAEMREEQLMPMESSEAPLYDTENVTYLSEIRDGQIAVSDLAIRANMVDASAAALPVGSRLAAHKKEAFFTRHPAHTASSNDPVAPPNHKSDAPLTAMPEPLRAARTTDAATHNSNHEVAKDRDTGSGGKKTLAVTAMLLLLLAALMVAMPLFPRLEGIKDMLSVRDYFSHWNQQVALWKERLLVQDVDREMQPNADAVNGSTADRLDSVAVPSAAVADDSQLAIGKINRLQAKAEPADSVADMTVQTGTEAENIEQVDAMQTDTVDQLLMQGREALDHYRLVTPAGDNAYEYLSAVLQQDPYNATALAGIQEIVDIYSRLAAKAERNNELEKAERYLDRGLGIQPDNPDLLALKDRIDRRMETVPVNPWTASPGGQTTRVNSPAGGKPSLLKRQAADRRLDPRAMTGEDN
ncbi:MAG: AAA family ATPase [Gammaproteobacteria bacterium]|jgi:type II secretory pathway predicted ATPase ExeA|nr:AAA family ATPase [Gammaproteobacteria bacterium]